MPDDTDEFAQYEEFRQGPRRHRRTRSGGDRRGADELPLRPRAHHRRRAGGGLRPRGDGTGRRRPPGAAALERRADRTGAGHPRYDQRRGAARRPADVARGGDGLGGAGRGLRALHALGRPPGRRRAPRRAERRRGGRGAPALALRVRRHPGDPAGARLRGPARSRAPARAGPRAAARPRAGARRGARARTADDEDGVRVGRRGRGRHARLGRGISGRGTPDAAATPGAHGRAPRAPRARPPTPAPAT